MNRIGFCSILLLLCSISYCQCSDNASQLYEDLMYNYIRAVRPVRNVTDPVVVKFGSSLIRIIEIDEKNQIFTTNLWLELQWVDSSLIWDPDNYNVKKLHIPADQIWLPDIVLYNNAAGNPEISIYTDALIHYDGTVVWKPPAIYKSFCEIDVTYFPYDEQNCFMKFGLWTHTGDVVDLKLLPEDQVTRVKDEHLHPEENLTVDFLQAGMDLSYYYINNEWDLVSLTCQRNEQLYGTCCGQDYYIDVTYYFQLRRKPLFYTVNLIVPCALISFLTTFVFYVPADAMGHQMTFSICILVTLTVFFLVLIDLIPPTSKVIPLFGSYLIFTLVLVTFSIIISVICLNLYHRSGATHIMPRWVRVVFIETLPKYFFIERPNANPGGEENISKKSTSSEVTKSSAAELVQKPISFDDREHSPFITRRNESYQQYRRRVHAQMIIGVIKKVQFIANHFKQLEEEENVANDWKFVAMVIDRIFFLLFSVVNVLGTLLIILWAPTLYGVHHHVTLPNATKPLGGDTLRSAFTST